MIRKTALIFFTLLPVLSLAQVTFIIDTLPQKTPEKASIYVSGDFEGWTGGQKKYRLQKRNCVYQITIPKIKNTIRYKFTLGSWGNVETDQKGDDIENRSYTFKNSPEIIRIKILNWTFQKQKNSTTAKNVAVLPDEFYIPQLNRKRRIWIYLPPDYHTLQKKYPVIYMHDGQNIFDTSTSFSGEWEVDETLNKIFTEKGEGFIVVGIDNGGKKRLDEYAPWKNLKYGGGEGKAYVDFLVKTLKPFIDQHYRTLSDYQNTAVFGSSMGGLISFYAVLEYPGVFGKAGIFSPSFWFSNQIFSLAQKKGNLKNQKLFMLAGNKEGDHTESNGISQTVTDVKKMVKLLKQSGFKPENITYKIIPEGKHNEKLWREHFGEAILWLFDE